MLVWYIRVDSIGLEGQNAWIPFQWLVNLYSLVLWLVNECSEYTYANYSIEVIEEGVYNSKFRKSRYVWKSVIVHIHMIGLSYNVLVILCWKLIIELVSVVCIWNRKININRAVEHSSRNYRKFVNRKNYYICKPANY